MKTALFALFGSAALLAACGEENIPTAPGAGTDPGLAAPNAGAPNTAAPAPAAGAEAIALGLTERQLLDADIVDSAGVEIGEVEGIIREPDGSVGRLLVEVEDSNPDKYVHIPLDGLSAVRDGDDWDIRAPMTREDLMAMPAVTR